MKRDFATSFMAHPDTGELLVRTGKGAVAQRIQNLVMISKHERPFSTAGSRSIRSLLFEPISLTNAQELETLIKEHIENNETEINGLVVNVEAYPTSGKYIIAVIYQLAGENESVTQQITLERVR